MISIANGHPRALEYISTAIFVSLEFKCDFESFFSLSTKFLKGYVISGLKPFTIEFLHHFVLNAFFVPQKNIFEGLTTKEECKLAQSLLSIAMIIDAVQKKEGKLWCGAKIDLFTFCGFWHYVIADHTNCWTQSLSDLIYAKESKKN